MADIIYGYDELQALIPERRPMLMLDRLAIAEDGTRAQGLKAVSMNEDFFQGHFPGNPIMPGVLQVAGMAQVAGALARSRSGADRGTMYMLSAISRLKFRKPVFPGDLLITEVEPATADGLEFTARTRIGSEVTCQGNISLKAVSAADLAVKPTELAPPLHQFDGVEYTLVRDANSIMSGIPHRYPFLLVDRVLYEDLPSQRIVGVKHVTGNEPFMAGLPAPILPGFLQTEIAAQAGCVLALSLPENRNKLGYFMSIDNAEFKVPVKAGDQLLLDVQAQARGRFGRGDVTLMVGDTVVSQVSLKFAVVDPAEAQ